MFKHPVSFTFIGFYLNSLVDSGEKMTMEELKKLLRAGQLIRHLQDTYKLSFDMSLFSMDDIKKIEGYFSSCYDSIDGERKFGVSKNALCLLTAYCFEAAQRNENEIA